MRKSLLLMTTTLLMVSEVVGAGTVKTRNKSSNCPALRDLKREISKKEEPSQEDLREIKCHDNFQHVLSMIPVSLKELAKSPFLHDGDVVYQVEAPKEMSLPEIGALTADDPVWISLDKKGRGPNYVLSEFDGNTEVKISLPKKAIQNPSAFEGKTFKATAHLRSVDGNDDEATIQLNCSY